VSCGAAWRLSAALFLATILPTSVLGIRRAVRVNREAGIAPKPLLMWRAFVVGIAGFVSVALASGVVGLISPSSVYPLALYALLIWSAVLFLRFFLLASHGGGG
jgi:hypothetical protein